MLPEEASRKLKAYEMYRKIHDERTIFEIHTDQENDGKFKKAIERVLKSQWRELMPNYMQDYIDHDHDHGNGFSLYKIHQNSASNQFWNRFRS